MKEASVKVEDGKLVKAKIRDEGGKIDEIRIRGDFFVEPPKALKNIETKLEGVKTGSSREKIIEQVEAVEADLIGFSSKDIAKAVTKAMGDNR